MAQKQEWALAAEAFEKSVRISPESEIGLRSAEEGAKVSAIHEKNYLRLTRFLKHILLQSKDENERVHAQKLLAETYFENLSDYENAILELNRAITHFPLGSERLQLRMMLAKSYFFLNKFFQARTEIDGILGETTDETQKFRAELLKANIYLNEKDLDHAISLFQSLQVRYPEKARDEQVFMSLAVCYEEKEAFDQAIEVLDKARPNYSMPETIDLKIKRLRERRAQLPGAKGLKK